MTLLATLLAGLGVGVVVGALGAGGGILSVPVLVHLLGYSPHHAAAGSLVVVILTALVSLREPARQGRVRWREGLVFGLVSTVGSVAGGYLSLRVDETLLLRLFTAVLLIVGLLILRRGLGERARAARGEQAPQVARQRAGLPLVALAATGTGLLTGFFGVGGGFVVVPVLLLVLAFPIREASGTSLLVMVVTATAGLLPRLDVLAHMDLGLVLVFTAASMAGGLAGGPLTRKVPGPVLTLAFGALLLLVALANGLASA